MAKLEKVEGGVEGMSFEEALAGLEGIVSRMERGEMELEKMVEEFERGSVLLKYCQKRLEGAEMRIEKLKEDGKFESFEMEGGR